MPGAVIDFAAEWTFSADNHLTAQRYDVTVDPAHADQAQRLLAA